MERPGGSAVGARDAAGALAAVVVVASLATVAVEGYAGRGMWWSALRAASAGCIQGFLAALPALLLLAGLGRLAAAGARSSHPRLAALTRSRGGRVAILALAAALGAWASGMLAPLWPRPRTLALFVGLPSVLAAAFVLLTAGLSLLPARWGRRGAAAGAGAAAVLLAGGALSRLAPVPSASAPSVLLISLDTVRADRLGCYGYPRPTSPRLDALSRRGWLFRSVTAQATNTDPSHASILTGLDPPRHGNRLNGDVLHPRVLTVAEALREVGYRTDAVLGGVTMKARHSGLDQGFDGYDDRFEGIERKAAEVTALAIERLAEAPSDRPLFLFVHYFDAHGPYEPPEETRRLFATSSPPPEGGEETLDRSVIPDYQVRGGELRARFYLDGYDGEIRTVDSESGRLIEAAQRSERGKTTWVIVLSDHGESLLERDRKFVHGALLTDEQIRIPLLVIPPGGGKAAREAWEPVQSTDVAAFILDIAGAPVSRRSELDGRSFRDLLVSGRGRAEPVGAAGGDTGERPSFAVARCAPWQVPRLASRLAEDRPMYSVRTSRWKLVRFPGRAGPIEELYDLRSDPLERMDVAAGEPAVARALSQMLESWERAGSVGGPYQRRELEEEELKTLRSLGYVN